MALLKDIEVKGSGIHAGYWRISRIGQDFNTGSSILVVSGYADQELRQDGKNPIHEMSFPINAIIENRSSGYPYLKADILDPITGSNMNPLSGATDA